MDQIKLYVNLFMKLAKRIMIMDVRDMYSPYHEMDIRHLVEYLNKRYRDANSDTRLKKYRKQMGMSQKGLAEITGISVRTIQQYEQRQKNINKARADSVVALAQALCVKTEDIMEKIQK